ncbi:tRNA (adenosine(37)-N6)-threonylcarbamoyltransferase complex ATPase subunit type 1 TsaE [Salibacteraceae bacterium]|jgi:tRNA threonylcarbamoyladenosine biosynthesis protein TsaE|nr:tRNA (adenosine(37)-N6)-threonylcarbamoyltransferase complex ATPase subunit type 1 TsaE [Salibacteraceae bacterium]MDA9267495.1 tRNA (adenosine(37)-N6)-threonylcarbamoyltransferase complex ATPase subunit type 1 TsaE [Salibacteraceae bacterium]MDB4105765.1 tRNA (adenosine(37)-N6)-threonylcarbamoyltransferase complex ATPase subunit type 1 TsaE [Salibacteraceae bacterium]MDB9710246.1 tRNA (adenosine(37)-N6)-threonylcarbamoyltransferase complex ATPase subunit type 1 TsaE [Salibacteraceae bacteriu
MQQSLTVPSLEQTEELKRVFRSLYETHTVFCFHGELGAGKTSIIKVLCQDLGVQGGMSSPSFSIVNEYDSLNKGLIYHFDLYRLREPSELIEIGWEDYLNSDSILFVEWPDKGGGFIPEDALHIFIDADHSSDLRTLTIKN